MLLTSERRFECYFFFFFKQKTAYEMRISDWSSDVYPSDLGHQLVLAQAGLNGLEDAGMHALDDARRRFHVGELLRRDRKSVVLGKRVSVRVDLGGRSIIKKKKKKILTT